MQSPNSALTDKMVERRTLSTATDCLENGLHVANERATNIEQRLFGGDSPKNESGPRAPGLPGVDEGMMRCQRLLSELLGRLEAIEDRA